MAVSLKKKTVTGLLLTALCLLLILPPAAAETRQGVIFLEGMEEPIEERLFASPEGFSFWYANDRLQAYPGEKENIEGAVVAALYSDDHMVLSLIPEEEAMKYAGDGEVSIAELSMAPRAQMDLYRELKDGQYSFCTLIAENGKYLRAAGQYAQEAAEGNAKFFQRVLDSVTLVNPDDYLGRYTNGSYDEVIIGKKDGAYTMEVTLYRLASLEEGTVSFSGEGMIFHTADGAGNPMTLSFRQDGPDQYALRIDESTWEYLKPGTVFDHMVKTADR